MNTYDPKGSCPKCGCTTLKVTYKKKMVGEVMQRLCTNCNYTWGEKPLDGK